MPLTRRSLRRFTWIAILVMWASALMPTIARALAAQAPASWVEVCTDVGMKRVAVDDDGRPADTGAPASANPMTDHCVFCSLGGPDGAALPASGTPLLTSGLSDTVPVLFLRAPYTLHAWAHAQPRAPPLRA